MGAWREKCFIYSITNPIDNSIFYVGETSYPEARFKQHMAKGSKLQKTMDLILNKGLKPIFTLLEQCDYGQHLKCEKKWITKFKSEGHILQNKDRPQKKDKFLIVDNTLNKQP